MRNPKMLTGVLATVLSVSMVLSSGNIAKAQEVEQTTEVLETVTENATEKISTQDEEIVTEENSTEMENKENIAAEVSTEMETEEIITEEVSTELEMEELVTDEAGEYQAVFSEVGQVVKVEGQAAGESKKFLINCEKSGDYTLRYSDTDGDMETIGASISKQSGGDYIYLKPFTGFTGTMNEYYESNIAMHLEGGKTYVVTIWSGTEKDMSYELMFTEEPTVTGIRVDHEAYIVEAGGFNWWGLSGGFPFVVTYSDGSEQHLHGPRMHKEEDASGIDDPYLPYDDYGNYFVFNLKNENQEDAFYDMIAGDYPVTITVSDGQTFDDVVKIQGSSWYEDEFVIEDGVLVEYNGTDAEVVIPSGVTRIGSYAFADCDTLEKLTISKGVSEIERGAFSGCNNLKTVTISDDVVVIEKYAFYQCTNLSEISFSKNLSNVEEYAFEKTAWLESQKIKNELVIAEAVLIQSGTATGKVTIPEGIKTIAALAFYNCEDITEIIIPSSVDAIGRDAFAGTVWLENEKNSKGLVIVNNVLVNGQNCKGKVEVQKGVTLIAGGAFYNNKEVKEVILPNGVVTIGKRAFSGCNNLGKMVIPPSVTNIELEAGAGDMISTFYGLEKLTIYGATGSHAEEIANFDGIPFVAITFEEENDKSDNNSSDTTKPEETVLITLDKNTIAEKVTEIESAKENATIIIDMKNKDGKVATVVPLEILESAKGKNMNVILNMGGYTWTIHGKDINAETLKAINLEVKLNSNAISTEKVKELAKDKTTYQLSLTHNGEFGFKAVLTINVGDKYKGQYGSLYYYDNGKFVFQNKGLIANNGYVNFEFSHASDYIVVMEENESANDETNKEQTTQNGNESPKTGDVNNICVWFALFAGVGLAVNGTMLKRKVK